MDSNSSVTSRYKLRGGLRARLCLGTALVGFVASSPAFAQTWTGGAGTTDWFDAGNWSTNSVPAGGAPVILNNGSTASPVVIGAAGAQSGGTGTRIGNNAGSVGALLVTGAGRLADSGTYLIVGDHGEGAVTVSNGGQVTSRHAVVANYPDTIGRLRVTGAGSQWTATELTVSYDANAVGSVEVADGAKLQIANPGGNAIVTLGRDSTAANGTLTVTGSGSSFVITSGVNFNIGLPGRGVFNLLDGASADTSAIVNINSLSEAHVSGTGSIWSAARSVTNAGILTVDDGGTLASDGRFTVLATGAATIAGGGTLTAARIDIQGDTTVSDGGTLSSSGDVWVGSAGGGVLTITGGGVLRATDPGLGIVIGNGTGTAGTLVIGAPAGQAAAAPGAVEAPYVVFEGSASVGTRTLVFNHTASDYVFAPYISGSSGKGNVNVLAGTTTLAGGVSSFDGTIAISSGATLKIARTAAPFSILPVATTNDGTLFLNSDDFFTDATGNISGAGKVVKTGAGWLRLTGENSWTGGTEVREGRLYVGELIGTEPQDGTLVGDVLNDGELIFRRKTDYTFGGVISGSGTFEKEGAGTLTLTGASTYAGSTTVWSGKLALGGDDRLPSATTLRLYGGTFDLNGHTQTVGDLAGFASGVLAIGTGALTTVTSGNYSLSSDITGTGDFIKRGPATLTLTGTKGFAGTATVDGGRLQVDGSMAASRIVVNSGGVLGGSGSVGATTVAGGGVLAGRAGQTLTLASLALADTSGLTAILGAPGGSALFNVAGALTLDGKLTVTDGGGFGSGTYRLFDYGGALTDGGLTIQSLPSGFNPGDWSIDTATTGQVSLLVPVSGPGMQYWDGVNMTPGSVANGRGGSGFWNATNTNWTNQAGTINAPWAGGTAVFSGRPDNTGSFYAVTANNTLPVAGITLLPDSSYRIQTVSGGSLQTTEPDFVLDVSRNAFLPASAVQLDLSVPITGDARLVKSGTGTVRLNVANSYTGGTLVQQGYQDGPTDILIVAATGALGTGPVEIDGSNARIGFEGSGTSAGSLTFSVSSAGELPAQLNFGSGATAGNAAITAGNNGWVQIRDGGSLGSATVTARNGAIVSLQGTAEAASGTVIAEAGSRVAVANSASPSLSLGSLSGAGEVSLGGRALTVGALGRDEEISGVITGIADSTFTKTGAGVLTLSGASTYTGTTVVESGRLNVTGSLANAAMTVSSALGGTGSIAGATTIQNGGVLIGAAGQHLTLQNLALNNASLVNVTLGAPGNSALFDVAGALTLDGRLNVTDGGGFTSGSYRLFDYGGVLTNRGLVIQSLPAGFNPGNWDIDTAVAGQVTLLVPAPPPPPSPDEEGGEEPPPPPPPPVVAQYWDGASQAPGGVTGGRGGSGVWNAGNTNWTNQAGTINAPWAVQDAIFAAAAGPSLVTVEGTQPFTGLTFRSGGDYRFTAGVGGQLSAVGMAGIDLPQAQVTIAAPVTGSGGVVKRGDGTLTLTGANTYTGGTSVIAGALRIGDGGTTGSIPGAVSVANGATLAFDRADTLTFDGAVSGAGALIQRGAGTLALMGDSSAFAGATTVQSGTLDIGGRLGGPVLVADGARLTGGGAIGGAVSVASGGTLAGRGGVTLAMGSLALAEDARIAVALGAPGGNRLFAVAGDLVLDGTVAVSDAGGFGLGVYRLFDYGGALTDRGLEIGQNPLAATTVLSVQTAQAGQVNLVVDQAGPDFVQFWNGAMTSPTGTVRGGSGVWNADDTNWTNAAGSASHGWAGGFAVFQGAAGTVTLAPSVSAQGLQFAVDGYRLEGAGLTLGAPGAADTATIRVGDGSAAGANWRATIAAPLSGAGGLAKEDLGLLVLTGANSYTGGTLIAAGGLRIGDGGTSGSILGDVVNHGLLAFDRADDLTFAGAISGNGRLAKEGAGTLVLAGTSSLTGATEVRAGTLAVTGTLAASAVDVAAGATLAGSGTVGGAAVAGTIAPTGELTVAGDYRQRAGSVYLWEAGDRVTVAGAAVVEGGRVRAAYAGGSLRLGDRHAILTAGGPLSGAGFAGLDLAAPVAQPFLTLGLTSDAHAVYLEAIRNGVSFASAGATANQRAAARALDNGSAASPVYAAMANVGGLDTARQGFDLLSGEIHATLKGALLGDSGQVREAVQSRLAQAPAEGIGLWAHAIGAWGHGDGNGNAASFDRATQGMLIGADIGLGANGRVGLLGGYSHSRIDVDARHSGAEADSVHLGVFAGGTWGAFSLRGGAAAVWHDLSTRRTIRFSDFASEARADYHGRGIQAFAEAAYRLPAGTGAVMPFVGLAHARLRTGGFAETGAAALHAERQSEKATWLTAGIRGEQPVGPALRLYGSAAWRHTLAGEHPQARLAFAGGAPFTIEGASLGGDAAQVSLGGRVDIGPGAALAVGYSGEFRSSTGDHGVRATLSIGF